MALILPLKLLIMTDIQLWIVESNCYGLQLYQNEDEKSIHSSLNGAMGL